ncbi:MAG: glycosyltransferase family 39 protein, partial [Acidobacteria bacterium]|nr:glycosyltransferase family 39 protein [Acidobacteriota bacterium]
MKSNINRIMSGITQSAIRNRHQELAAIILSFVAMLIVSWRRWTSPIADSGREMDLPLRLLRGEMLYSDINYLYPPFSPYFNSQLYRIFGAHLEVLLASGICWSALIVALCYRIARRLLSPAEATIAAMAVVVLCLFKPTGNLIWPYSFAALYGMVFALAALLMTLRYSVPDHQSRASLLSAGVFIGLAAITKQEFAIAAAATVTAALVYLYRESPGKLLTELSHVAIPAVIITVPV